VGDSTRYHPRRLAPQISEKIKSPRFAPQKNFPKTKRGLDKALLDMVLYKWEEIIFRYYMGRNNGFAYLTRYYLETAFVL
jgi:hypothetical protein